MRKSRFSEEQIIRILGEVEAGSKVKDVCREHRVSEGTYYRWKSKFGGMGVNEARRLKNLEFENRRLKTALADLTIDNQERGAVKKMVTPATRRAAATFFRDDLGLSQRRSCRLSGFSRSSLRRPRGLAVRSKKRKRVGEANRQPRLPHSSLGDRTPAEYVALLPRHSEEEGDRVAA